METHSWANARLPPQKVRTEAQPQLDARARSALLNYLAASGVEDPLALLPRALAADPDRRPKHQRLLLRAMLLLSREARVEADLSRLYVAWAEVGFPDPPPADLKPITKREREYALRAWDDFVGWLCQLGVEPHPVTERRTPRQTRDHKRLRLEAEQATEQLHESETRLAARVAIHEYHTAVGSAQTPPRLLPRKPHSARAERVDWDDLPPTARPALPRDPQLAAAIRQRKAAKSNAGPARYVIDESPAALRD
jgi:hypothetical protein